MTNNEGYGNFGMGLLIGAAIGLAVGILYAPRPGKETRALIREKAMDATDKAEEIIDKAKERAEDIVEKAKAKAAGLRKSEEAT